jgi:hypothetical protein
MDVIDGPQSGTENTPSADGRVPAPFLLNCIPAAGISEGPLRVVGSFPFTRLPVSAEELTTKFQQKRAARHA